MLRGTWVVHELACILFVSLFWFALSLVDRVVHFFFCFLCSHDTHAIFSFSYSSCLLALRPLLLRISEYTVATEFMLVIYPLSPSSDFIASVAFPASLFCITLTTIHVIRRSIQAQASLILCTQCILMKCVRETICLSHSFDTWTVQMFKTCIHKSPS